MESRSVSLLLGYEYLDIVTRTFQHRKCRYGCFLAQTPFLLPPAADDDDFVART